MISTMHCKYSLVPRAYWLALCLLFFGVANGLASQQVRALVLKKCVLVGDGWPALSQPNANLIFHYFIGDPPSYLESFTEILGLKVENSGPPNYIYDYVPYGYYPLNPGGYIKYPYFYREMGIRNNLGTVPDTFSEDDLKNLNNTYNTLPEDQKFGLTGGFTYDTVDIDGDTVPVFQFDSRPVGTSTGTGGVYAYDKQGNVVQSFPDGTGYASGYQRNADGSYSPVYYKIDGDNITQTSSIPTTDYSSLSYDSDSGTYSLDLPDYTHQLDTIITRLDNIDLRVPAPNVDVNVSPDITVNPPEVNVNVPSPEITVNPPEVNVNVAAPEVTVNPTVTAPDVIVNVNTDSSTNGVLTDIKDSLNTDSDSSPEAPGDLTLDSDEQALVNQLRDWETDIPLLGDVVDFGLNSLLGKIPDVGTEYVWMDYTLGGSKRSSKSSPSNLEGYHIRIDLTPYRDTLLAIRGWLIILEALYFILLIYRNIREALQV